jgi:hypothetical protein
LTGTRVLIFGVPSIDGCGTYVAVPKSRWSYLTDEILGDRRERAVRCPADGRLGAT